MKSAPQTQHHIVRNPDVCSDEYLPAGWHDHAERTGMPDEEIYRHWRRFKDITRWPFEGKRWFAYIDKIVLNSRQR